MGEIEDIVDNDIKIERFVDALMSHPINNNQDYDKVMKKIRRKFKMNLSKNQIREYIEKNIKKYPNYEKIYKYLIKRAMRSQSGVLVVTVVLPPSNFSCKYDCAYCPQEFDLKGNKTQPRSYISSEPAMRRANRFNFDIREQIWDRINTYYNTGNISFKDDKPQKLEIIVSGGTWESYPREDRDQFIKEIYWGANTYFDKKRNLLSMEQEQEINETAKLRVIGLTLETRPDNISEESIKLYRWYGVTRVQIGVQHFDSNVLKKSNRGCYTKHTIKAIRLLKQTGYKVVVHLMPDLPGSSPECDLKMFKRAIEDPDVQFDDVKIYPTAVTKTFDENLILYSKIADDYEKGLYKPYAENNLDDLINVLKYYLSNVRPWVRIQRLVRDIPTNSMTAGYCKKVNLRQMIMDNMKKNNEKCLEIRNMEVKDGKFINYPAVLVARRYVASGGIEYHLSFEAYDNISRKNYLMFRIHQFLTWLINGRCIYWNGSDNFKAVFGFLRLRFDPNPGGDICPEINECALIREVHVYGRSLGIGNDYHSAQHRGYGKKLINAAENISYQAGYKKTAVIAGIGTKQYYQYKNGYSKSGTFMVKNLEDPNKYLNYYRLFFGFIILFFSFIDHFI